MALHLQMIFAAREHQLLQSTRRWLYTLSSRKVANKSQGAGFIGYLMLLVMCFTLPVLNSLSSSAYSFLQPPAQLNLKSLHDNNIKAKELSA